MPNEHECVKTLIHVIIFIIPIFYRTTHKKGIKMRKLLICLFLLFVTFTANADSTGETKSVDATKYSELSMGIVLWYDRQAGFGMLTAKDDDRIFVHYSIITVNKEGTKALKKGQRVQFTAKFSEKGWKASVVIQ